MRVVIAEDDFLLRDGLTRLLAIGQRLVITGRGVAKHTASIFLRLALHPSDDDNRWVLAVLVFVGR